MIINGFEIDYKIINNKMKYTVLSIHGVNSSMGFTGTLDEMNNNFNHIKISLPIDGQITIEDLNKIIEIIIQKHIRSKYLILLGHSLGGIHTAFNAQNKKVKKVIFVAPFNPSVYSTSRKLLVNAFLNDGKISALIKRKIDKHFSVSAKLLNIALDDDKPYRSIFKESLFNQKFIEKLDDFYRENKKETLYIIGSDDKIIMPKDFKKYVSSLGGELEVVKAGHNPFTNCIDDVHKLLNDFIPRKRKFIKRIIFKKK